MCRGACRLVGHGAACTPNTTLHLNSHTWQVCTVLNRGSAHLCCHLFCQNLSVNHCGFIHFKYPYLCRMPAIFLSLEANVMETLTCRVASVRASITLLKTWPTTPQTSGVFLQAHLL